MDKRTLFYNFALSIGLYYVIPLLFIKYYNGASDKAGFTLILMYTFSSFAITLLISYFCERKIYTPILSIIISLQLLLIFNTSAIVVIIIIVVFSFISYLISGLFA